VRGKGAMPRKVQTKKKMIDNKTTQRMVNKIGRGGRENVKQRSSRKHRKKRGTPCWVVQIKTDTRGEAPKSQKQSKERLGKTGEEFMLILKGGIKSESM